MWSFRRVTWESAWDSAEVTEGVSGLPGVWALWCDGAGAETSLLRAEAAVCCSHDARHMMPVTDWARTAASCLVYIFHMCQFSTADFFFFENF